MRIQFNSHLIISLEHFLTQDKNKKFIIVKIKGKSGVGLVDLKKYKIMNFNFYKWVLNILKYIYIYIFL